MGNRNVFGNELPTIREIAAGRTAQEFTGRTIDALFDRFMIPNRICTADDVIALASGNELDAYENEFDRVLSDSDICDVIDRRMGERLRFLYANVSRAVSGSRVLDFGCGTGVIGGLLAAEGYDVTLADIYRDDLVDRTGLPFVLLDPSGASPFSSGFDTTLLVTVLHHCDDPLDVLGKAADATRPGGRVVVVEPVYGVVDGSPFGSLGRAEQACATVFLDHLYGRILHFCPEKEWHSNPPNSFNSPEGWASVCAGLGLARERMVEVGFNDLSGPYFLTVQEYRVECGKR